MYKVNFLNISEFDTLETDWRCLQIGEDMTYFQRYEWYEMLVERNKDIVHSCFDVVFGVVKRNADVVLIAPLWIVKRTFGKYNKKGIYIYGRGQWSDYLTFIYKDFCGESLEHLFAAIKENWDINDFYLEDIPASSKLYSYIKNRFPYCKESCTKCVHLNIPNNKEDYHKLLSKSSRQNLRTAVNRANRDGITFYYNFDDKNVNHEEFVRFRDIRVSDKVRKYHKGFITKAKLFLSKHLLKRGIYTFVPYYPFVHDKNAKFITVKDSKGILCAGFCYGHDIIHNRIVLMAVSTNPEFYKYSPGVLGLYKYILNQIDLRNIEILDFTRGDEMYKFSLGGQEHLNFSLYFQL